MPYRRVLPCPCHPPPPSCVDAQAAPPRAGPGTARSHAEGPGGPPPTGPPYSLAAACQAAQVPNPQLSAKLITFDPQVPKAPKKAVKTVRRHRTGLSGTKLLQVLCRARGVWSEAEGSEGSPQRAWRWGDDWVREVLDGGQGRR